MEIFKLFSKKRRGRRHQQQDDGYTGLIASKELKAPATEAYRVLRTNIHYAAVEDDLHTLLFTSAGPGEGKSTTSANTAAVMAQSGKKVLLVDCDLRKPSLHKLFAVERTVGITNVLVENWKLEDVVIKTLVPNLHLVPSGPVPPNPAELLQSVKFEKFLSSVREKYDSVVIDAPPTIAVTDACVMSSKVDGVVLVCNTEIVKPEWARKAKSLLEAARANIIGVVLNRVAVDGDDYYYYYYYSNGGNV